MNSEQGTVNSREIKFRQPITAADGKFVTFARWGVIDGKFVHPAGYADGRAIPESQQFTGLKDKNGVEIYEGDILEIERPHAGKYRNVIEWKEHAFWLTDSVGGWHLPDIRYRTVIGNIHENSELLEVA